MPSDILLTAAIGGIAGSIVTAISNLYQARIKQESVNVRRRAEFYLERKVDALMELHSALEHAKLTYIDNGHKIGYGAVTEEDVNEVINAWRELERKLNHASVFLDEDQQQTLGEAFNKFHEANPIFTRAHEEGDMNPSDFSRSEIHDKYREASEVLKEEMNGPIKEFRN